MQVDSSLYVIGGRNHEGNLSSCDKYLEDSDEWESLRFRTADVLLRVRGDVLTTFVSHHYWKPDEACYVMRVSVREDRLGEFRAGRPSGSWRSSVTRIRCRRSWCFAIHIFSISLV